MPLYANFVVLRHVLSYVHNMTRSEYKIFRKFHRCTWVYHHLKNGYHKAISNSIITCKTCKSFFSIKYTTSTMSYNQLHKRQKKLYYYKIITSFAAKFKMSKVVLRLWYFSNALEHLKSATQFH